MKTTIIRIMAVNLCFLSFGLSCSDKENSNTSTTKGNGNVHYGNTINSLNEGVLKISAVEQNYIFYDLILFSTNYNFNLATEQLTHGDFKPLNYIKFTICLSKNTTDLNGDGRIDLNDLSTSYLSLIEGKYPFFNGVKTTLTFTRGEFSKNDPSTKLHIIESGTLEVKYENNLYVINYDGEDTEGVSLYCDFRGKINLVFNHQYINQTK